MQTRVLVTVAALVLCLQAAPPCAAEEASLQTGVAAYGDWRSDAPGVRRKITAEDMPAPLATQPVANPSRVVSRPEDAWPKAPPGFSVSLFAKGFAEPRVIRVAPNGDILVADSRAGQILAIRAEDGVEAAESGEHTYTEIVDALGMYGAAPQADTEELWRRIALSILMSNADDHLRSHGDPRVDRWTVARSPYSIRHSRSSVTPTTRYFVT